VKVVVDATTLDGGPSGAATRLAALSHALLALPDADVGLLHLVRPGVDPLPGLPSRAFAGCETPWGRARAGRRLQRLLREEGADVLHLGALPVPRVDACPVTLTLHDLRFLEPVPGQGATRRLWARLRLPANLRRVAAVVAVSETTAAEVVARLHVPAGAVVTIPNAGTPGLARVVDPSPLSRMRRRAALNARYLLALGPLAAHKRPGFLLEVLAALRRRPACDDVMLAFAGRAEPGPVAALGRRAEAAGLTDAVRVFGPLPADELATALSGADALVVPGRVEGFSLPVVDAQALGVPVVASRAGALPEVAGEETAWLADPEDAAGFAAAVEAALAPGPERDERLRLASIRAAGWSWERSAAALAALWHELAGRAAR
jgi:glycosyltransferase involved in cell wall biosynthesis